MTTGHRLGRGIAGVVLAVAVGAEGANPPFAGVSDDWLAQARVAIAAQEYHVTRQQCTCLPNVTASWQAPNRAHDLRTCFTENGPRVVRRTEWEPSWVWGLELLDAPALENTAANGNRIEFHRAGGLVEWYVNDAKGLEQGFTIGERPARDSALGSSQIVIALAVRGDLRPGMMPDGKTVEFLSKGGVGLIHYGGLKARDAAGRELPARMELTTSSSPATIRLVVDAAGAQYPITVDPLATSAAWTAESDQADARFGLSAGTAGDVNGDGYSDVIVGAFQYDNGQTDEGRAFVYYGSAAGLSATPSWSAESDQAGAYFGYAAGTAGDVNGDGYSDVIVGAHYYDNGQTDEGRAFVYCGSAAGLSATPNWSAESDQASAYFGNSVGTAGDVNGDGYSDVIVGAYYYDNGETDEGRAFVYHGSVTGLSATPNWSAESDQAGACLGRSVGTAGDVNGDGYADVIVGAYYYDNGQTDEGKVYVYHGSASGLAVAPNWTAESDQADANLGWSAGTAGDVNGDGYADVIVGAYYYDNGQSNEGRAYVYYGSAAGLSATPNWSAESDQAGAYFGISVATAGDVNGDGYADVIVGAYGYDNGQSDEGRAYVYCGSAAGLSATAAWTAESDQADAYFGRPVGTAGDGNGDGYSDVIVGAYYYDNGQTDEGRVYVYLGGASGLSSASGWAAESDQAAARFGLSAGTAGDVNGDGYSDVIVGAFQYDNGQTDEGRAFVYYGSAAGLSATPSWSAESDQASAYFGYAAGTAGDVNGDGYSDVIVGAHGYDNGQTDEGRAFVYHGSAAGLPATPNWTAESDQASAYLGRSVGTAGDVNGDGYSDVIVGAYAFDGGQTDEGKVYVYHGSASGLAVAPNWTAESDQADATLGWSAGTAGDVNGDGYSDVIVGAYGYDNGQTDEGRVYVYYGSAAGLSATPNWSAESDQASAYFGYAVGTAGDVNGDGYSDVIVGVYGYDNGQSDEGRAYVYCGSAAGLSATANWTAESDQADAYFGRSVGTAGDVNGDGYADVIVGAYYYDNGQTDEGAAFVYYGNGEAGRGLSLRPQLRRADDSAPIQTLGKSGTSARLAALGRTPFGRGKVKIEYEIKPFGTAFNGSGTVKSPSWTDIGTTGVALGELAGGLSGGLKHWRVRLLYHPATTPFMPASRWFTAPLNGQQEADLRASAMAAGTLFDMR